MKDDSVFALTLPGSLMPSCSCASGVMWNNLVAGGIPSCLYSNCDQKMVNGAAAATTTAKQSCVGAAYGSCTAGQKEHSAR